MTGKTKFDIEKNSQSDTDQSVPIPDPNEGVIPSKKSLSIASISFLIILGIVITGSVIFAGRNSLEFSSPDAIRAFPFTAHFRFNISNIKDSVFTDFGYDDETYLAQNDSIVSYNYPIAGEFNVLIYTRDRILDSFRVISCSDYWIGGSYPSGKPELFEAFRDQSIFRQGSEFYAPLKKLTELDFNKDGRVWTAYKLLYPQNVQLDKLTLETWVLNTDDTGIRLIGKDGVVDFTFTQENGSRYAKFRLSEKSLDGQEDDLDALSVDLSDWLDIRIEIDDNELQLFLSDELIFEESYYKQMGMLVGVAYTFLGSGKIDYLNLKNHEGESVYSYDFSADSTDLSEFTGL